MATLLRLQPGKAVYGEIATVLNSSFDGLSLGKGTLNFFLAEADGVQGPARIFGALLVLSADGVLRYDATESADARF